MKRNCFPAGWDEVRVRRVLDHYERQTEDEAVAEDETAFRLRGQTVMVVPKGLVPEITRLIEGRRPGGRARTRGPNRALRPTPHKMRVAEARGRRARLCVLAICVTLGRLDQRPACLFTGAVFTPDNGNSSPACSRGPAHADLWLVLTGWLPKVQHSEE